MPQTEAQKRASEGWRERMGEEAWRAYRTERKRVERERYPEKLRARARLKHAVQLGDLPKPGTCEACGQAVPKRLLHGHHHLGYDRPLEVQWLCAPCHRRADASLAPTLSSLRAAYTLAHPRAA